jgi:hypothetical protein
MVKTTMMKSSSEIHCLGIAGFLRVYCSAWDFTAYRPTKKAKKIAPARHSRAESGKMNPISNRLFSSVCLSVIRRRWLQDARKKHRRCDGV